MAVAEIAGRTIHYEMSTRSAIWCKDAAGAHIGVIIWSEGQSPSLHLDATDPLVAAPCGAEVELIVRCAMAAWRQVTSGEVLDPALPVTVNPALLWQADRSGREGADAGR